MDKIYFAKTKPDAIIPSKEEENAGYDIYACFEEDYFEIPSHETKLIPTGIAWASSPKYYLQIEERSSTGSKGIKRSAGVIDSGYRGEILIAITNSTKLSIIISKLEKEDFFKKYPKYNQNNTLVYPYKKAIAQGIVHIIPDLQVKEIPYEQLFKMESKRGKGGWGSSGKWKKSIKLFFYLSSFNISL